MNSLQTILESRDARAARQRELLGAYPGATLISFTVIPPGPVKRTAWSPAVAAEGLAALRERFGASVSPPSPCHSRPIPRHSRPIPRHSRPDRESPFLFEEERDLPTGFEAFLVVDLPAREVKRACCEIEDSHPHGRLMDIDVLERCPVEPGMTGKEPGMTGKEPGMTGSVTAGCDRLSILSRTEVGLPERRCLLCERPARECIRAGRHTTDELLARISEILKR